MADISDLNPEFASRLAKLRAALTAAGINNSINSGYRSPEYQQQLIDQGVRPAASPWRSFHQYGLAADLTANDYKRMWAMAPQYGLHPLGAFDPGHVEMAGSLPELISQYHLAGWRPASQPAPATGAIPYGGPMPSRPGGSRPPGTSLYSSPLDIVLQAESGDRNINNTHQGTSSGQAQGNLQITTGTWADFAPKAGIDLKQYPTPESAPRDVQIKVGSLIPLNRWASSTVNAVLAKYPGIDTSQTLGSIQSAALNGSGGSGSPAGGPPAAPASPAAPAAPGALPGFQAGSAAEKMANAGLKQLSGGGGDVQPMQLQQAPQAQAVGGPMMMGAGQQNMQGRMAAMQSLAQQGFLTQPSVAAFTPSMPGTTLNSPSQLLALQAGLLKSPYDSMSNPSYYTGAG